MNSSEIAKLAGVSRSTVSRVINNYSNVPEETREKVLKGLRNMIMYHMLQQECLLEVKTGSLVYLL